MNKEEALKVLARDFIEQSQIKGLDVEDVFIFCASDKVGNFCIMNDRGGKPKQVNLDPQSLSEFIELED